MTILPMAPKIVVLGSGAWGTALALSLARNGRPVTIWAHSPEAAKEIVDAGENVQFLPGFRLPPTITVTGDNAGSRLRTSSFRWCRRNFFAPH